MDISEWLGITLCFRISHSVKCFFPIDKCQMIFQLISFISCKSFCSTPGPYLWFRVSSYTGRHWPGPRSVLGSDMGCCGTPGPGCYRWSLRIRDGTHRRRWRCRLYTHRGGTALVRSHWCSLHKEDPWTLRKDILDLRSSDYFILF